MVSASPSHSNLCLKNYRHQLRCQCVRQRLEKTTAFFVNGLICSILVFGSDSLIFVSLSSPVLFLPNVKPTWPTRNPFSPNVSWDVVLIKPRKWRSLGDFSEPNVLFPTHTALRTHSARLQSHIAAVPDDRTEKTFTDLSRHLLFSPSEINTWKLDHSGFITALAVECCLENGEWLPSRRRTGLSSPLHV